MVCEKIVAEFEKKLNRKLTNVEKKKIEEKCHHNEISEIDSENKFEEIALSC